MTSPGRSQPSPPRRVDDLAAIVRVPPFEGAGHAFVGVMLEAADGTRWVASYRADELWKQLAGRRVVVSGERYEPEGQASTAPHVRVDALRVVEPTPEDPIVAMGAEQTLRGRFEEHVWPPGTKLAGEKSLRFVASGGTSYPLANAPSTAPALGRDVEVRGRAITLSPFSAHEGGPFLWVVSVGPK